jgi:benzylsuccinate CoA-transferase BbsF subunit
MSGVFTGLRIIDFSWAAAGPITTRHFADYGATVIKIESSAHPDSIRTRGPYAEGVPGINRSGFFAPYNPNKLSVSIDMTHPTGREVAKRLIEWAGVVVESFTPRVMPGWGMSFDELRKLRPDLIMLSTCMQGQTGPYRSYAGYGSQGAALSGFFWLNGWPDRQPSAPYGAYTDMVAPHFATAALIAALDYRDRTGIGQQIDLSQVECGMQFLAPQVLDYTVNGRIDQRMGNQSFRAAPHGVFPTRGEERWIAIAIETDAQWCTLVELMESPAWLADSRLAHVAGRLEHREEIEARLGAWTEDQDGCELMTRLQAAGIPSGVANPALELFDDPQLVHRRHFVPLDHAEMGTWRYDELGFKLSDTPSELRTAAPCLGEHTELVLKEWIGYSDAEYADLVDMGALK